MSMLNQFKDFAMRGNIVDLAIGFTVGAAFSSIAKSLVDDVLMPPIGLVMGRADFSDLFVLLQEGSETPAPYATLADAQQAGAVTLNYGAFVNNVVAFLIVALAMFLMVRSLHKIEEELSEHLGDDEDKPEEPAHKKCRFCRTTIAFRAVRCPNCTSQLTEGGEVPAPAPAG